MSPYAMDRLQVWLTMENVYGDGDGEAEAVAAARVSGNG